MKLKKKLSLLAVITLLLPLLGSLGSVIKVNAAAVSPKIMTSYQTYTNNYYTATVTEYTYSMNGVVQQSSTPPTDADWVTPSNYYDYGWIRDSWNETYTYSNFGVIYQTDNVTSIPATAAWATLSYFQIESTNTSPIYDTVFQYSLNGVDVETAVDALNIPANALWATLASFKDGWTQITNTAFADYTLKRTAPNVQAFSISSNSGSAAYARKGDQVTVALQTDIPIAAPLVKIADIDLTAAGAGTDWSAILELTDAVPEGPLSVSASVYSSDGMPGPVLTATTNGSSVIYDHSGPSLSYTLAPGDPTNGDVTVQIGADDAISGVQGLKWAAGTQAESYFTTGGTPFTNDFVAAANGAYTVYAQDAAGNATLLPVTVSNIDRAAPNVTVTASTTELTNTNVVIQVSATDNAAISKQLWTDSSQNAAYFQGGGDTSFTGHFDAASNGVYTVYVEDTAGNHVLKTISVSNVFKQAPELALTPSPVAPTRDSVYVAVEAKTTGEAEGNTLTALRWSVDEKEPAFFASGGGDDILSELEFEGAENGKYSVYARDKAGNESVAVIDISNIDRTAPRLTLTPDTTALTNSYVIIMVLAEDYESGIKEVRWSSVAPKPDLPWSSIEVTNGSFEAVSNGTYTVMVVDEAGNETLQQISVTNIRSEKPTLELTPDTVQPTGDKVSVIVEAAALGADNTIEAILWAEGDQPLSYFPGGQSENITSTSSFEASANGVYTVYARDLAGNAVVETIEIHNIDLIAPTVSLTASTTEITNANVAVQVAAADNVAVSKKLWAEGLQDEAYFQGGSGTSFTTQFAAAQNGIYTVYVEDTAGNHEIATITISNVFKQAPALTLTPIPATPTTDTVFIAVEAETEGAAEGNILVALRWAEGERLSAFFASGGGEDILHALEFEGSENGKYSVYARDKAGNETVATIDISNIDRLAPRLALTPAPADLTNGHVVITVTAEDEESGISEVRWSSSAPQPDLPWSSNEVVNGSFQVNANGTYTVIAEDRAGNKTMKQIGVSNIRTDKPTLLLTPNSTGPTGNKVTVTVKATANGDGNAVEELLWTEGEQPISFFQGGNGDDITDTLGFDATKNGVYTVYVRDLAGNEATEIIEINNIDTTAPTVSLAASTTAFTNSDVEVQAAAADNVAIGRQLWAEGLRNAAYFQGGEAASFNGQFHAPRNGVYTVYIEDTAGNHAIASITISNVFKQAPTLTLTPSPAAPTKGTVMISVTAKTEGEAEGNTLAALRWAEGDQDPAGFALGGGVDILGELEFEGVGNGKYSVYARDKAGNETIAEIQISNIDRSAPTLTLTPDTTDLTNKQVVIAVTAEDEESGLREVRWGSKAPAPDLPWTSQEVTNGAFQVDPNGTYTVIAIDQAGNETIQQINVENIRGELPTLLLTPNTIQPTGDKVSVTVKATAMGGGNALEEVLWAEGELPIGYFREGQSKDITEAQGFEVSANGAYTVYARDLAGNEAVATIEIDNIRSTIASLTKLVVQNGDQALALSPSFAPDELNYTVQVKSSVNAIRVSAAAEDASATVSVNGSLLASGDTISVPLNYGANSIRIVVTASLATVQQTYIIEATREKPVMSETGTSHVYSAKLNGKEWTGLAESIRNSQDGGLSVDLKLDDASSMIDLLQADRGNELRIELNSQAAISVNAVVFNLSPKALSQLKGQDLKITISIGDASYEIPADVQVRGDGGLVVNVQAVRDANEKEQLLRRLAQLPEGKKWQPKSAGMPLRFSANSTMNKGSLVLSLPNGLDETALRKLAVFVEQNEGTYAFLPATIRYNAAGQATGAVLEAQASGRAILLQAEPVTLTFERYINGYADGSFAPERAVTRAELAMLLMKLSAAAGNSSPSSHPNIMFADVAPSHWAAEAISFAADHGWMSGYTDGLFQPNKPLTRAELASILARWRKLEAAGQSSFQDASAHWASAAIASAEKEGWINGYADGSFRPGRSVTRAEAVTILNRVLQRPPHIGEEQAWSDVPASHWAAGAIGSASRLFKAKFYLGGEVEVIEE